MIVEIINITDGPGKSPTQVDIYNKTLAPGAVLKLPADLVDRKLRRLESEGLIAIGAVPPWYASAKVRRGRKLTPEEMQQRIKKPSTAPPKPSPPPSDTEKKGELLIVDEAVPAEETTFGKKRKR